jgi:hypothetical protein
MSIEQIDMETVKDRSELQSLSEKQLCKLLSITVNQLRDFGFSKENLIEMFLTQHFEL